MRIGVFGGTFDPVHLGHLILAEQCREQGQLDQVLYVPAARPPHKRDQPLTPFAQRAEMLALAIAGQPAFRVDELERERPGPSFTVETLEAIHVRQPADELFLVIGSDTLDDLPQWREPVRVLELAGLLVAARPNWEMPTAETLRAALQLPREATLRLQVVQMPLIEISSRDLRRRASEGRSISFMLPRAVEVFIREKHIYS